MGRRPGYVFINNCCCRLLLALQWHTMLEWPSSCVLLTSAWLLYLYSDLATPWRTMGGRNPRPPHRSHYYRVCAHCSPLSHAPLLAVPFPSLTAFLHSPHTPLPFFTSPPLPFLTSPLSPSLLPLPFLTSPPHFSLLPLTSPPHFSHLPFLTSPLTSPLYPSLLPLPFLTSPLTSPLYPSLLPLPFLTSPLTSPFYPSLLPLPFLTSPLTSLVPSTLTSPHYPSLLPSTHPHLSPHLPHYPLPLTSPHYPLPLTSPHYPSSPLPSLLSLSTSLPFLTSLPLFHYLPHLPLTTLPLFHLTHPLL